MELKFEWQIIVAPGNGGTSLSNGKIENVAIDADDIDSLVNFAKSNNVALVVVGPEIPLVRGLADAVAAVV